MIVETSKRIFIVNNCWVRFNVRRDGAMRRHGAYKWCVLHETYSREPFVFQLEVPFG